MRLLEKPPAIAKDRLPLIVARPPDQFTESLEKGLKWRSIGPYRGGRVLAVTGVPTDPNIFYFGGVAGGVWRTTNAGLSWTPLFDKQSIASIGAIAVAGSNPNVIYVGTGEACIRGNISYGNGVYKSMDGGRTWFNTGLTDTQHIANVLVHPGNPDIVFVAALGHAYGPNDERGVYRTLNGGKTWERVLFKDNHTGAIDIAMDPHNPNVLFAALYQVQRTPWSLESGGPGSGLYQSTDGGTTWRHLEGKGLPTSLLGRIGISVSGADSNRVYSLIEAKDASGLYRSDDGGENWTNVNDDQRLTQRAWYFTHIFADPKSVDTVYMLNTGMFRSQDAGKTLELLPAPHGDHHGLWIDPNDPQRMINGNDGGATITVDGGKTWTTQENQPTAQFYHVATDNQFLYYVYGAQQDNSTVAIASRTDDGYIGRQHWYDEASPHAAASAYAAIDCHKLDDLKPYIYKTGDFGKTWLKITKGIPDGAYVHVVREDPVKPGLLYAGTETGVFVSYDAGASWQSLQLNLPVSPIHDLVLKNNDLLVATHGRSFWILDDISPLRQLAGHSPEGEMLLLNPALTYRVHFPDQFERHRPVGENPPNGAIVTYFFRSAPKGEVTLEILDDKGALIRRYSSIEKKQSETPPEWPDLQPPQEAIPVGPGFNRFTWDLRYAGPHKLPGEVLAEFRSRGPMAPPGNYQVKLSADGKSLTVPLELKMDPRVSVSAADMAKEFELELKIRDTLSSIHETIQEIREARVQLRGLGTRLQDPRFKSVFEAAESLDKKMTPIEEQLLQVNAKSSEANLNYPNMPDEQLHYLVFSVEVDDAPTQQQYAVFEALSQQTAPLIAKWKEIRSSDLVTLNNLIQQNVPAIYLSPGAN
jgi:photosystem II stability/assembly factor-like uncharacterized protein